MGADASGMWVFRPTGIERAHRSRVDVVGLGPAAGHNVAIEFGITDTAGVRAVMRPRDTAKRTSKDKLQAPGRQALLSPSAPQLLP